MHIHELTLSAHDLVALHSFYTRVLGLPAREVSAERLTIQAGSTLFSFIRAETGTRPYYHFALNIPPASFAAAQAWLRARVPLLADQTGRDVFHSENWDADNLYFLDPAGNILELIARHTLPAAFEPPFGPQHLLCVSEIGVATEDVPATVRALAELGVEEYRGPGSETFNAVGDEHGLCIVVKRGRVWFPDTGRPAVVAPLEMLLSAAAEGPRVRLVGMPPRVVDVGSLR